MGAASDLKMYRRAIVSRWDVTDDQRKDVRDVAMALLHDPDPRIKLSSVKCLIEMVKTDQKDEHKAMDIERDASRKPQSQVINNLILSDKNALYGLLERVSDQAAIEQEPTSTTNVDGL